jgi:uncharacterized protein YjeT (DUF2065 family)
MNLDGKLLALVLGLVLIVEGLPYFLFPERITSVLRQLEELGPGRLRPLGLTAILAGVALLVLGRWVLE